ncbi:MAG: M14 family metallopeptidase [Leptospira sp.]|nr:M14 family metallopeptidase [Leptospira sp.]
MKELFFESYKESKDDFVQLAHKICNLYQYSELSQIEFSKDFDAIDVLWIRRNKKPSKHLILVSSGVHGVEGFAGSAIQRNFMHNLLTGEWKLKADILLLHGINSFGFQNKKRVNENNIDLNRNFYFNREKIPKKEKNKGYKRFASFFMPKFPFTFWYSEYFIFIFRFTGIMFRLGIKKFSEALANGQFEFKKGLYFGGKKPELVVKRLRKFFKLKLVKYNSLLHLDIHTGHGKENGVCLIQNAELGSAEDKNIQKIVKGLPLLRPDSETAFYKTAGDFTDFLPKVFPNKKSIYPLTVELGTTGNLTFWKALKATFLIVAENRIRHHGTWFESNRNKVDERFFRYFYPQSEYWREIVLSKTTDICKILIDRFQKT